MVMHSCNPNTLEVEAGGSEVQDLLLIHSEFEASLNLIRSRQRGGADKRRRELNPKSYVCFPFLNLSKFLRTPLSFVAFTAGSTQANYFVVCLSIYLCLMFPQDWIQGIIFFTEIPSRASSSHYTLSGSKQSPVLPPR